MARPVTIQNNANFSKGIITELSKLDTVENSVAEFLNLDLSLSGKAIRRFGIDYESSVATGVSINTSNIDSNAIAYGVWESVGGNGDLNFLVAQYGSKVYFYDMTTSPIDDNLKSFSIDLTAYQPASLNAAKFQVSMSSGKGYLWLASEGIEALRVEYDADTDDITVLSISPRIRDIIGVDDGLDVDERPATLSDEHKYNLLNQGWDTTKIDQFFTDTSTYPSNADIWYLGRDADSNFDSAELEKQAFGTSEPFRGSFILDAFDKDYSTVSGVPLANVTEDSRASCCAIFASRLFLGHKSTIYFSQTLVDPDRADRCYSEADPTSEHLNELIDTDGGNIELPDSGEIIDMVAVGRKLIVFSKNGVWAISGIDGYFVATGFVQDKISNLGIVGKGAAVNAGGTIYYISKEGVQRLVQDQVSLQLNAENVSQKLIDALFKAIPVGNRSNMRLAYDPLASKLYVFYAQSTSLSYTNSYLYDSILIFDTELQAWTRYTISSLESNTPYIIGGVDTSFISTTRDVLKSMRFLTLRQSGSDYVFRLAHFEQTGFMDWYSIDNTGVSYSSTLQTQPLTLQDVSRLKQAPYVTCFFDRTEKTFVDEGDGSYSTDFPGSCLMTAYFSWTDNSNAGMWSTQTQVYRHRRPLVVNSEDLDVDNGFPVVVTKTKVRGHGKSIALKFDSEAGKDYKLLGFSIYGSGSTVP